MAAGNERERALAEQRGEDVREVMRRQSTTRIAARASPGSPGHADLDAATRMGAAKPSEAGRGLSPGVLRLLGMAGDAR